MARSIWKGTLTFGLVSVPVELFPAQETNAFSFSMLDKRDFAPVGYKRYNKASGKEIEWGDIVKGYEYEKGQYVVMTDEDFKRANVKASRTIEITTFVPSSAISPEYFESPYYLVPGKGSEKVYALLRETMAAMDRFAIAQFVIRSTQHLAAVGSSGRALMLYTLRYSDELRSTSGFELPAAGMKESRVTTKEIDLAKRLISDMSGTWDPKEFKDTYHEDLMKRIQEKIKKGQTHEITKPSDDGEETPQSSNVIDLAALLQKSLRGGSATEKSQANSHKAKGKPKLKIVRPSKASIQRKRA